jgi:hypothetical protein
VDGRGRVEGVVVCWGQSGLEFALWGCLKRVQVLLLSAVLENARKWSRKGGQPLLFLLIYFRLLKLLDFLFIFNFVFLVM